MRRIVIFSLGILSLMFLYSCMKLSPVATIDIVDSEGNQYLITGRIGDKELKVENGKVIADVEDDVYEVELNVNVFKKNYRVDISNGHGKIVLEKSSNPAADILIKNTKKILVIANLEDYKGVGIYFDTASTSKPVMEDAGKYLVLKSPSSFAIAGKKGVHLKNWMEFEALDSWNEIIKIQAVTDTYEQIKIK